MHSFMERLQLELQIWKQEREELQALKLAEEKRHWQRLNLRHTLRRCEGQKIQKPVEYSPDLEKRLHIFSEKNKHLEDILKKLKGIQGGEMGNLFLGYGEEVCHYLFPHAVLSSEQEGTPFSKDKLEVVQRGRRLFELPYTELKKIGNKAAGRNCPKQLLNSRFFCAQEEIQIHLERLKVERNAVQGWKRIQEMETAKHLNLKKTLSWCEKEEFHWSAKSTRDLEKKFGAISQKSIILTENLEAFKETLAVELKRERVPWLNAVVTGQADRLQVSRPEMCPSALRMNTKGDMHG
ncbi:hypothetical protein lerEdw1_015584 [Lerista edwardsae]|nr:hypothetical protein lerEdw1_015584 [Lerista edwardsae]